MVVNRSTRSLGRAEQLIGPHLAPAGALTSDHCVRCIWQRARPFGVRCRRHFLGQSRSSLFLQCLRFRISDYRWNSDQRHQSQVRCRQIYARVIIKRPRYLPIEPHQRFAYGIFTTSGIHILAPCTETHPESLVIPSRFHVASVLHGLAGRREKSAEIQGMPRNTKAAQQHPRTTHSLQLTNCV